MALDELIERIEHDAGQRIQRELEQAHAQAAAIVLAARTAAAQKTARAVAEQERALRAKFDQVLAANRAQARAQVMHAREALLTRAFTAARAQFDRIATTPAYAARMAALLELARSYLPAESVNQPTPVPHGYELTAPDSSLSIPLTLDTELARYESRLRILLCKRLEDGDGGNAVAHT